MEALNGITISYPSDSVTAGLSCTIFDMYLTLLHIMTLTLLLLLLLLFFYFYFLLLLLLIFNHNALKLYAHRNHRCDFKRR